LRCRDHVFPAINVLDVLVIVRDGHIIDTWAVTARGKIR
jgi:hypothetical protein